MFALLAPRPSPLAPAPCAQGDGSCVFYVKPGKHGDSPSVSLVPGETAGTVPMFALLAPRPSPLAPAPCAQGDGSCVFYVKPGKHGDSPSVSLVPGETAGTVPMLAFLTPRA